MNTLVVSGTVSRVGPASKPPSQTSSRGRIPSRSSSLIVSGSSVFAAGFPGRVAAGRINPLAAARVLGHFGDLGDVAELGRLAQLRPRVEVADGNQPVGDLQLPSAAADLL